MHVLLLPFREELELGLNKGRLELLYLHRGDIFVPLHLAFVLLHFLIEVLFEPALLGLEMSLKLLETHPELTGPLGYVVIVPNFLSSPCFHHVADLVAWDEVLSAWYFLILELF